MSWYGDIHTHTVAALFLGAMGRIWSGAKCCMRSQVLKMAQLRSFSRAVLFAGTPEQCRSTVELAEQYRDKLEERGVLLVPLPIYAAGDAEGAVADVPPLEADDLRCARDWASIPANVQLARCAACTRDILYFSNGAYTPWHRCRVSFKCWQDAVPATRPQV